MLDRFTESPFDLVNRFPFPMPGNTARDYGRGREWEHCDKGRQQNRRLYIGLVALETQDDKLRLAIRTAALVCSLGSGLLPLPSEPVAGINEFVVVTFYQVELPQPLVTRAFIRPGR